MFLFDFFSPKDPSHQSELFSTTHLIFLVLSILLMICLLYIFKNTKEKGMNRYLKFMTFFIAALETTKIIWEGSIDISSGNGFNYGGLLPLYLCSMFIYALPIAAFGRGKVKQASLGFLASLGIVGGLSNLIFTQMLIYYPFFHFSTFVSIIFHFLMAFTGFLIVITNCIKFDKKDYYLSFIPTLIFSLFVIPIAYTLQAKGIYNDYMLLLHGNGVPLLNDLGNLLYKSNLQWLFTIIMLFILYGVTVLMVFLMSKLQIFINKKKVPD